MAKKNTPEESKTRRSPSPASAADPDDFLKGLKEQAGARVIGPVRIESRISKGGMGIVYRGRHVKLDIDVAVKFLLPNLASENPEYVVRFEREAKIAAQLNNENLVRVFDVDSEKNYHYVVMELVCGETARDRVARKGPLSESEAMEIILGATRGLEAAHRKGIVHRDIKPENIMIDAAGIVKLADLGIAKMVGEGAAGEANLTQPGFVMGTPSFMPPEQFHDSSSVGFAGDVYSMGATLYFLLTGKAPYSGTIYEIVRTISAHDFPEIAKERPGVSPRLVEILRNATARDPRTRYSDATALLRALEASGTGRLNLTDPDSGTVTAIAKVSTPPARRFGEIHVHVPPPAEAAQGSPTRAEPAAPPSPRAPPHNRRGLIAIGSIALFALLFGAGLYPFVFGHRDRPGDPGKTETSSHSPLATEASKGVGEKPDPGAHVAVAPTVTNPPANQKSETPPARTTEKPTVEDVAKPPVSPPAPISPPRKEASESPLPKDLLEKSRATRDGLVAEMKRKETLVARAENLLKDNMLSEASNVLNTFEDWGDLRVKVSRLRLRVILAGGSSNEAAARKYLGNLCADPKNGGAGGACEQAFEEIYAHVGEPPPAGAGTSTFERRVELWKSFGQPPADLKKAVEAAASSRARLFSAYLKFLGDQGERAFREENVTLSRQALDRAVKFVRDEKAEDFTDAVSRIGTIRKSLDELESELKEWAALLPLNPGTGAPDQLKEAELRSRVSKFKAFAEKYPASPRKVTAVNYQARFQKILDGRRVEPR